MSCNGCRVLRKKCSQWCSLRQCLEWIDSPEAQSMATLFLSKFFGRSDLMLLIESVPCHNRSELFRSLLFEACGRIINPVYGAIGLLCSGRWHLCEAAVTTVLAGGVLIPLKDAAVVVKTLDELSDSFVCQKSFSSDVSSNNEKELLNLYISGERVVEERLVSPIVDGVERNSTKRMLFQIEELKL